jgi:hypothetical protein
LSPQGAVYPTCGNLLIAQLGQARVACAIHVFY